MSRSASYTATKEAVQEHLADAFLEFRKGLYNTLIKELAVLDFKEANTLQIVVGALIESKFEQKEISDELAVSRTTINRWAHGSNIPKSIAYREWIVGRLMDMLRKNIPEDSAKHSGRRAKRPKEG